MVIWIKFIHSSPFLFAYSSISCLTTSNLPWFMDLIFQIPMQYCSLQHRTLLLSPVTSTSGYCFCFGSIPSFFFPLHTRGEAAKRSYPTSEVRGSSQEGLCHAQGCGREEQPHLQGVAPVWAPEGLLELFHVQGQKGQWWGDTPFPR